MARYGRLDLLCLDELGYVQLDARGAELLFQILTEREEKASVATASNLPFCEWGQVIADPRLVAAIVDRLTFNAHIIETGTESFRLRSTRTSGERRSPPDQRTRCRAALPGRQIEGLGVETDRASRRSRRAPRASGSLSASSISRIAVGPAQSSGGHARWPSRHTANLSTRGTVRTDSTTTSWCQESPKSYS